MRKNIDLLHGSLWKNIILYALPIIATGELQLLFNAADLVVVGRFCGSISVAAVGSTGAIINLVINLFIGLSIGVGVLVATGLGANDQQKVHNAIHTAIPISILGGLFIGCIGFFITKTLLFWMGTPEDVIDLSALYMKIYFCGLPFSLLYNYGAAILRADGDTKRPLVYLSISGILNVILNLIFVIYLSLDVAGVALATIISQGISSVLVLRALLKEKGNCRFSFKEMRINPISLREILRIGIPAGLQSSMFSLSNTIIQSSVNSFGSSVMAGCSAGSNIEGFAYIAMNSFNHSAMNFIGQNYGAGQYERVKKISKICLFYVFIVGALMSLFMIGFSRQLLGIYITDSKEAIEYGMLRMKIVCTLYFLNGMHDTMTGILRGFGASMVPMIVTVFGICVFRLIYIYTIFQIPAYHNITMLFTVYPLSWIVTLIALIICYIRLIRRKIPKLKKEV